MVGYLFPFFNRQIDRAVFDSIRDLQTVYIQAPNPLEIKSTLEAVLPIDHNTIEIVTIQDCYQFYLLREV